MRNAARRIQKRIQTSFHVEDHDALIPPKEYGGQYAASVILSTQLPAQETASNIRERVREISTARKPNRAHHL